MNVLNAKLLETLKCPCCSKYMKSYIYVCPTGHSVCNSCWLTNACPICNLEVTDVRNVSLEKISSIAYYPCNNEEKGCQKYLLVDEMDEHQLVCDHRRYDCRLNKFCSWRGTRDKLKKHYLDNHERNILIGNECTCLWKPNGPDYTVYMMMALDEMFYVHAKIRNDIFYWTVQYVGHSEDVILYYFELDIFTDQFNDRKLQFSEICHDDIKENIDEIIETGFCVAVPMTSLETFLSNDGAIFYKVKIKMS